MTTTYRFEQAGRAEERTVDRWDDAATRAVEAECRRRAAAGWRVMSRRTGEAFWAPWRDTRGGGDACIVCGSFGRSCCKMHRRAA